jgi:hypothetical protein
MTSAHVATDIAQTRMSFNVRTFSAPCGLCSCSYNKCGKGGKEFLQELAVTVSVWAIVAEEDVKGRVATEMCDMQGIWMLKREGIISRINHLTKEITYNLVTNGWEEYTAA